MRPTWSISLIICSTCSAREFFTPTPSALIATCNKTRAYNVMYIVMWDCRRNVFRAGWYLEFLRVDAAGSVRIEELEGLTGLSLLLFADQPLWSLARQSEKKSLVPVVFHSLHIGLGLVHLVWKLLDQHFTGPRDGTEGQRVCL